MVKNTTGGSKAKGQARKFVSGSKNAKALRVSTDESEVYAQVTKYLGNGMCDVICCDGISRLCHIRGKFRGRGKKDNLVTNGSWLLVGLREWATEKKEKKDSCDLLEVYSEADKENLKNIKTVDWAIFMTTPDTTKTTTERGEIEFSNEKTDEHQALMDEEFERSKTGIRTVIALGEDDIDVDDI